MSRFRELLEDRQGFALVAAIWLSGLVMVIAVGFATNLRLNTLLAANRIHQAELTSIAEGMLRYKAWQISGVQSQELRDGQQVCQWNERTHVYTTIQDHAGLIDLNLSPEPLLALGFQAVGADTKLATELAVQMLNYRDVDNVDAKGDAEAPNRDSTPPKNRNFEVVEELDLLPAMTDEVYRKAKQLFSVYAGQTGVDFNYLPIAFQSEFSAESKAQFSTVSPRKAFEITSTARLQNGLTYGVKADVIVIQQPDRPFALLTWQYVSGGTFANTGFAKVPPCLN